jgi:predicted ATP-grasp superfamily ATP-dependent carboligase
VEKQETKIHGTFVIDKNARQWTPEVAVHAVFGMSLKNLIKDIQENRDGKYDSLYIKGEAH